MVTKTKTNYRSEF